jgi:hypothetical protein
MALLCRRLLHRHRQNRDFDVVAAPALGIEVPSGGSSKTNHMRGAVHMQISAIGYKSAIGGLTDVRRTSNFVRLLPKPDICPRAQQGPS